MEIEEILERLKAASILPDLDHVGRQIEPDQVVQFYLPLARRILALADGRARFLVGLAGPPGSGKSILAGLLRALIRFLSQEPVCVIGMDGWHYNNEYLDSHLVEYQGRQVTLRQIKGAPETFDFLPFLECVQAARRGAGCTYPIYDRQVHDPSPQAGRLTGEDRIVIFEGNYLLLDEAPWGQLRSLFDLTLFIRIDAAQLEPALLTRHLLGGRETSDARQHIRKVDLPNTRRILKGFSGADFILHKLDPYRIISIEPQP